MNRKTILVVAAHPDDEILGCGGTIAKLAKDNDVYSLVLGEGVTSRDNKRVLSKRKLDLDSLKKEMKRANKILGVKRVFCADLPDNRFDSIALLDITKQIEKIITKIKPVIVFTHFGKDLNIDHQLTYQSVLTATRPLPEQSVKEIYAFETVSSTEFNFPLTFSPDSFSEISEYIDLKIQALAEYSEMRPFPHPRSLDHIRHVATYWGTRVGLDSVEPFQTIRKLW